MAQDTWLCAHGDILHNGKVHPRGSEFPVETASAEELQSLIDAGVLKHPEDALPVADIAAQLAAREAELEALRAELEAVKQGIAPSLSKRGGGKSAGLAGDEPSGK